jgi:CheY-like chemotaxis protein
MIARRMSITQTTPDSVPSVRSILVVDDDPAMGLALRHSIGAAGYNVVVAASGEEALAALASDPTIDAALIDFEMYPMDGIELCRQLVTRQPRSQPFPIWIMTGRFSSARWAAAIQAGAIDLFPKPFERERFLGELQMAWTAHQSGRPAIADGTRLSPS